MAGLDERSRAVLFVKGIQSDLQADALREHPRNLSDALVAARMARRQLSFSDHDQQSWKSSEVASRTSLPRKSDLTTLRVAPSEKVQQQPSIFRLTKLTDELRRKLMREGRCFKCRQIGHLSKDCPDRSHPNDKLKRPMKDEAQSLAMLRAPCQNVAQRNRYTLLPVEETPEHEETDYPEPSESLSNREPFPTENFPRTNH